MTELKLVPSMLNADTEAVSVLNDHMERGGPHGLEALVVVRWAGIPPMVFHVTDIDRLMDVCRSRRIPFAIRASVEMERQLMVDMLA